MKANVKKLPDEQINAEYYSAYLYYALQESDHATYQFILWYIKEQIEEKATASDIHQKITLTGENHPILFTLDAELAARTITNPFVNNLE